MNYNPTPQAKKEITDWLTSHRPWDEGTGLYRKYGYNRMLQRYFRQPETAQGREMLTEELRKTAGLTQRQLAALPRLARNARQAALENAGRQTAAETEAPAPDPRTPAAETVARINRFRKQYPFLNEPDCPDILKVLVADMFTAYHRYVETHRQLAAMDDSEAGAEAERLARETVESYLRNREIRAELDYYREHHRLLGNAEAFRQLRDQEDVAALSDLDLAKKLQSTKVNLNKQLKKIEKGDETARAKAQDWEERLQLLRLETENRKKKSQTSATGS